MRVVEFLYDRDIPEEAQAKYSFDSFTGGMIVRDWDDNIIGGFQYKDGKPVAALRLDEITINEKKQKIKTPKNGRMAGGTGCGSTVITTTSGWYFLYNGEELFRYEVTTTTYVEMQCFYDGTFDQSGATPGNSSSYNFDGGPHRWY